MIDEAKLNKLKNAPIERKLKRNERMTQKLLGQNQQRALSRMYQKKFIERREQQIQIINKQLATGSDDESRALAYAMKTQVDSTQNIETNRRDDSSLKNTSTIVLNK